MRTKAKSERRRREMRRHHMKQNREQETNQETTPVHPGSTIDNSSKAQVPVPAKGKKQNSTEKETVTKAQKRDNANVEVHQDSNTVESSGMDIPVPAKRKRQNLRDKEPVIKAHERDNTNVPAYHTRNSSQIKEPVSAKPSENSHVLARQKRNNSNEIEPLPAKRMYRRSDKDSVPSNHRQDSTSEKNSVNSNITEQNRFSQSDLFCEGDIVPMELDYSLQETVCDIPDRALIPNYQSIELYPGISAFCSKSELDRKILHDEIHIEVLDLSSIVLKRQFSVHHGLVPPSRLYSHVLENRPVPVNDCIPSYCTAIQIHYVEGHYVVFHQFMRTITVYDSLPYIGRREQVMPQLKILYRCLTENPNTPISYCSPQHQGYSSLCGAVVVASTVALLIEKAPLHRTEFLCAKMRTHLL